MVFEILCEVDGIPTPWRPIKKAGRHIPERTPRTLKTFCQPPLFMENELTWQDVLTHRGFFEFHHLLCWRLFSQ